METKKTEPIPHHNPAVLVDRPIVGGFAVYIAEQRPCAPADIHLGDLRRVAGGRTGESWVAHNCAASVNGQSFDSPQDAALALELAHLAAEKE